MIKALMDSVRAWHEAAGIVNGEVPTIAYLSKDERELRRDLLAEEWLEYMEAEEADNIVEIADALGDMMYVIAGTALSYGINLEDVIQEICYSNDTKIVDGKVLKRDDGKILKPDTYIAPDLYRVLFYNSAGNINNNN